MPWLNRVWRLIMTGFCFFLFGAGGLVLSQIWFRLLVFIYRDAYQCRNMARRSITASFGFLLKTARFVGVLDYHIEGADLLRSEQGCLIVANHPTLIDYVLIASVMPDMDCLVKAELLRNPFTQGVIRAADYLINSQGILLLAESKKRLEQGDSILIFPEGTRTQKGKPLQLQRGAANIAIRCRRDLRVIHICCSQDTLQKHGKWYQIPSQKPVFTVQVKQRIAADDFMVGTEDSAALAARHLNRYLTQVLVPENGKTFRTV